jgi:hypothetical protein
MDSVSLGMDANMNQVCRAFRAEGRRRIRMSEDFYYSEIQFGNKIVTAKWGGLKIGDCHNESHQLNLTREEALKLADFIRVAVKEAKQP